MWSPCSAYTPEQPWTIRNLCFIYAAKMKMRSTSMKDLVDILYMWKMHLYEKANKDIFCLKEDVHV